MGGRYGTFYGIALVTYYACENADYGLESLTSIYGSCFWLFPSSFRRMARKSPFAFSFFPPAHDLTVPTTLLLVVTNTEEQNSLGSRLD